MRLIDADALLEKYNVKDTNIAECLTDKKMARAFERFCIIADAVEEQPTVYAVPVVRCEKCRYGIKAHGISDGWVLCAKPYVIDTVGGAMHRCDWFCADGERTHG